jgi:hypothetical protein
MESMRKIALARMGAVRDLNDSFEVASRLLSLLEVGYKWGTNNYAETVSKKRVTILSS